MKNLHVLVTRYKRSHDYMVNPKAAEDYSNNRNHNSLDVLAVYDNLEYLKEYRVQTIANHPDPRYKYKDSLAQGAFQIKAFVEPRAFHGRPHGIVNGTDLEGQPIDEFSMQMDNGFQSGRWLIHDKYSFTRGMDTANAWSGGCIIMSSADLADFGKLLEEKGTKPGDIIQAFLVEV